MDASEAAFRAGFQDGQRRCLDEDEAWRYYQEETSEKRFREHLEQASRIVATWPWWKRGLLDNSPTCKTSRRKC